MDKFEEMRNFIRVVDAGSITSAAESMHLAKSAVSRRLSDLEERLDIQLLNRTTRRMTLTDAGQRFYADASRLLADLDSVEAELQDTATQISGRIRLAAPTVFGRRHLGPAITEFIQEHSEVEFDIEFNDRHVDIVEEGFDMAVRIAQLSDSRMMARKLAPISGVVAAAPKYWEKAGRPKRVADLQRHSAIQYSYQGAVWQFRDKAGKRQSVRVPTSMRANNGDFILEAAISGLGVIRQPRFICHEAINAGLLEPVLTQFKWMDVNAYVIYPQTRHLPQRIRVFIDYLAELWGDEPYWEQC